MKVLRASAGSGKTYRLAHAYIDLLTAGRDPDGYRHILAVTFTNKATASMKQRILNELSKLSEKDSPEGRRARGILIRMLHDYGAFSVSTIDRFFQQALKAFSREIGQFSDYQVELDKDSLIQEAMDRILDRLTEDDRGLIGWMGSHFEERLLGGGKTSGFEKDLYEAGKRLKSEEHRRICEQYGLDERAGVSKEELGRIREKCRRVVAEFERACEKLDYPAAKVRTLGKPRKKTLEGNPGLAGLYESGFGEYCTASAVLKSVFGLGFAEEFYREFDALLRERNLMCLDDSSVLLRDIIDGSDAPFVYEKLGVRYNHFLLDEFQDTSNIQWENFLPLLRESESRGGGNLIVGDVKQCIYRFRDSDWTLLGGKVTEQFPDAETKEMVDNWRSQRRIVDFNNRFFSFLAKETGMESVFSGVNQTFRTLDPQEGYVRVSFADDQLEKVGESIKSALDAGARPGDITILVRNNKLGSKVADSLIGQGYEVISDDSLHLTSSPLVRKLLALLGCIADPENSIDAYMADGLREGLPGSYHSLQDLCEKLLRVLQERSPELFEGQTAFIQAFLDHLQKWTDSNGGDLAAFLRDESLGKAVISCPESSDAIRVITVHKAKGLEFEYLIFPFADKVGDYNGITDTKWCRSERYGGVYPITMVSALEGSGFDEDYRDYRRDRLIDDCNLFYVALTRARKCLHVIAKPPGGECRKSGADGAIKAGKPSDYLYHFIGRCDDREYGTMYDFTKLERTDGDTERDLITGFRSIDPGTRLTASEEAEDFFGEDGICGVKASARLSGKALHGILASVSSPGELDAAVDGAVGGGVLGEAEGKEALSLLSERIAAHPEWFRGGGFNERSIIGADGREYRPDRVVVGSDGSATIIDYKFGDENDSYRRQVERYMRLYRQLGYRKVSGLLWYVREDKVTIID